MFLLKAQKNKLTVLQREMVTSGSANVYRAQFEFSEDWDGLAKTVYFRSGTQTVPILLGESGECVIPWEVTDPDDAGKTLYAGVCGTRDGKVVLPTVEAGLGIIMQGTGWAQQQPTPGIYEQILTALNGKQDELTGLPDQVVGFDEEGRAVPKDMPTGPQGPEGPQGEPGPAGAAGVSPMVEVTEIDGGHQVTITDVNGPKSFDVMDGVGGSSGSGTAYKFGHGLKTEGNTVFVNMASDDNPDKTLPISAAAVDSTVGNIEILLKIIRGV